MVMYQLKASVCPSSSLTASTCVFRFVAWLARQAKLYEEFYAWHVTYDYCFAGIVMLVRNAVRSALLW